MNRWVYLSSVIFLFYLAAMKIVKWLLFKALYRKDPSSPSPPLIDHSAHHLKWNLASEMQETLKQFFAKTNRLYLAHEENFPGAGKYLAWADPFETDTSLV